MILPAFSPFCIYYVEKGARGSEIDSRLNKKKFQEYKECHCLSLCLGCSKVNVGNNNKHEANCNVPNKTDLKLNTIYETKYKFAFK